MNSTSTPDDPWASLVRDVEARIMLLSNSADIQTWKQALALIAQYRPTPDVEVGDAAELGVGPRPDDCKVAKYTFTASRAVRPRFCKVCGIRTCPWDRTALAGQPTDGEVG